MHTILKTRKRLLGFMVMVFILCLPRTDAFSTWQSAKPTGDAKKDAPQIGQLRQPTQQNSPTSSQKTQQVQAKVSSPASQPRVTLFVANQSLFVEKTKGKLLEINTSSIDIDIKTKGRKPLASHSFKSVGGPKEYKEIDGIKWERYPISLSRKLSKTKYMDGITVELSWGMVHNGEYIGKNNTVTCALPNSPNSNLAVDKIEVIGIFVNGKNCHMTVAPKR